MSKEALVKAVKTIHTQAREGKLEEAYAGYRELFESPWFAECKADDQRQALRLMIFAKGVPERPTDPMVEAHRAAVQPLTELVSVHGEPSDFELLGICHVVLGNTESADRIFRAGLNIERQRNAGSDLCGAFMKRISLL